MMLKPAAPLPPTSKTMKMMAAQRKDDTEPSEFEMTELEMNRVRNECCVGFLVFLVKLSRTN